MKVHTTNYENTFIAIADDSPVTHGEIPPVKGEAKSVATMQFEMLSNNPPYTFTSDDVLFSVYADRKDLTKSERPEARKEFFSKGQPCFRASPLTKRYGWGIHNNKEGKMALVSSDSAEYEKWMNSDDVKVVKAMKSSR
jgi:hypothetical protein